MDFCLILRAVKDILHLSICHCGIQFLHITEFLNGNHSTNRTIWQCNFSGITLHKLLRQNYLTPTINIVIENVGKYSRIFYIILCNCICSQWDPPPFCVNIRQVFR